MTGGALGSPQAARARAHAWCLVVGVVLLVTSPLLADEQHRPVSAGLLQKAWAGRPVRVIVELGGVGALPEGQLRSRDAVATQRERIASDRAALRFALRGLGHRVLREFKTVPYVGLEVDYDTLRVLDALPGLATRVHEDVLLRSALAQSGPLIQAPLTRDAGWDGTGQVIAILDTGVDNNHPFLAGKVVSEACYDSSGVSTCPNQLTSDTTAGAGVPCTFAAADCAHGTHVAGIAAGSGAAFDGVAPGASLIAVQVFHEADCGGAPCARASLMDIVAGLERVLDLHASSPVAVANLSLNVEGERFPERCDDFHPMMTAAIENLKAAGVATVVSSGNDGFVDALTFPACISHAVSVGATSDGSGNVAADQVMAFSNSAFFLSLLAPGYLINSSEPGGAFANLFGTSMAAAHVSGAWAVARQAFPAASVDEILAGLRNTGRPIFDPGNGLTKRRIAATLLEFSASAYNVAESAGTATVTVTRTGSMSGPHAAPLTVDFATSADGAVPGQDYTETSGTLTFLKGEASKTFSVAVGDNPAVNNGGRRVKLTLSNPGGGALLGGRDTADLGIVDDDVGGTIQFSASAYSRSESTGPATIVVTRTGGAAGDVTVRIRSQDGTGRAAVDYEPTEQILTFAAGQASQSVLVTLLDNALADGSRTVTLVLDSPGGGGKLGALTSAVLTILDDDVGLRFSAPGYTASEKSSTAIVTVTRTGPTTAPVGVTVEALPGTATPGVDYQPPASGLLKFAAGQTSRTLALRIRPNPTVDGPRTVLLRLTNPTGGAALAAQRTAVLTITDDDAGGVLRFGAPTFTVTESAKKITLTVSRSGGVAGGVSVDYAVTGGSAVEGEDFVLPSSPHTLTFAPGQTSRSIVVTVVNDLAVEPNETVVFTLQNPQGGASIGAPASATLTIVDGDRVGTFQFLAAIHKVSESSPSAILRVVRLGSTTGEASVQVSFEDDTAVTSGACDGTSDYVANPQTLVFPPGRSSRTLAVPICPNTEVDGTRAFKVQLSNPSPASFALGAIGEATVRIADDEGTVQFGADQIAVNEGASSVSLIVTRIGGTAEPVVVSYAALAAGVGPGFATPAASPAACSPDADFRPVAGNLSFAAGQASAALAVPLCGDGRPGEGEEAFAVSLTEIVKGPASLGAPVSATVAIRDNDGPLILLGASKHTVNESKRSVAITIRRLGALTSPASVELVATSASSATGGEGCESGVDFVASTQLVSFAAKQASKTAMVELCPDLLAEGPEAFQVHLQNPVGADLGFPRTATVTVSDDETAGDVQFSAAAYAVSEGQSAATITLRRTAGAASGVSVHVLTEDGTAAQGLDYEAVDTVVQFGPDEAVARILVPILPNALADGTRRLTLHLDSPAGGAALGARRSATLWIVDDE
jgi:hypothetical protein